MPIAELFQGPTHPPRPSGIRVGETVLLTGLTAPKGKTLEEQSALVLDKMQALLKRAGAGPENVGRVAAFVTKPEEREDFYKPWEKLYPNKDDKPACKAIGGVLQEGCFVSLDVFALRGARRKRIDIAGVPARDPTVIIGNYVFSSRVHGTVPDTGQVPEDLDTDIQQTFRNIFSLVELAGGNPSNVTQLTAFVRDPYALAMAGQHFAKAFPDDRPAYHPMLAYLSPRLNFMLEMVAVL